MPRVPDFHPRCPRRRQQKVIQYLHYKVKYANSTQRIPEFPIEPEMALELLMASNFLEC